MNTNMYCYEVRRDRQRRLERRIKRFAQPVAFLFIGLTVYGIFSNGFMEFVGLYLGGFGALVGSHELVGELFTHS